MIFVCTERVCMTVCVLEWVDSLFFFRCVTFSSSNFLSGNQTIGHMRKGDKFTFDKHDGTARHVDGKGRDFIVSPPKSVAIAFQFTNH